MLVIILPVTNTSLICSSTDSQRTKTICSFSQEHERTLSFLPPLLQFYAFIHFYFSFVLRGHGKIGAFYVVELILVENPMMQKHKYEEMKRNSYASIFSKSIHIFFTP